MTKEFFVRVRYKEGVRNCSKFGKSIWIYIKTYKLEGTKSKTPKVFLIKLKYNKLNNPIKNITNLYHKKIKNI